MYKNIIFYLTIFIYFFTNINILFAYSLSNDKSYYELIEAIKYNDPYIARYIRNNRHLLNYKDDYDNTTLSYAISNQNYLATRTLLQYGADPNIIDSKGKPIYCRALKSKNQRIRNLFADYDIKDCNIKRKTKHTESIFWDLQTTTIGLLGLAGIGGLALIGGAGGGSSSNNNSYNDGSISNDENLVNHPEVDRVVGEVNQTDLDNILTGKDRYFGYTYSNNYYSNFDDYNQIRLAYSFARGFTGKVIDTTLTPYNNTTSFSYNVGDRVKVAVVDEGVYSNLSSFTVNNNIGTNTNSYNSNQIYEYYKDNCINEECNFTGYNNSNQEQNFRMICEEKSYNTLSCNICNTDRSHCKTYNIKSNNSIPFSNQSTHGTNVASIIVSNPFMDGNKMQGHIGIAPDAIVIPYLIASSYDMNGYSISSFVNNKYIANAFQSAGQNGVMAINNSWGTSINWRSITGDSKENLQYYNIPMNDVLNSFYGGRDGFLETMKNVVNQYDSIFVFAAGNEGQIGPSLESLIPLYLTNTDGTLTFYDESTGYYKNFISVVAFDTSNNSLAYYSNRCGIAKEYCITAPGSKLILSDFNDVNNPTTYYTIASGTSFAAPIITAAIAVIKGAFPYMTGAEITKLLFLTARDLGAEGVDEIYGWGMLDLEKATRPYGVALVPIDERMELSSIPLSHTKLTLNNIISNSIKSQNLEMVFLDSFNRTFKTKINNFITSYQHRPKTIDILSNFANYNNTKIFNTNDKLFNLYYHQEINNDSNINKAIEVSYNIPYNKTNYNIDNIFSFSLYYGNNPYNAFIHNKVDFNNYYSLANMYGYNALNPYFKTDANNNYAFNNIISLNNHLAFNIGALYQTYTAYHKNTHYNEEDEEELGDSFSVISGITYKLNKNLSTMLETSIINEKETFLGNKFDGAFSIGQNNYTYLISLQNNIELFSNTSIHNNKYLINNNSSKLSLITRINYGYSDINLNKYSLIKDISRIHTTSYSLGINYNFNPIQKNHSSNISLLLSKPITIHKGHFNLSLPYSRDVVGNIYYKNYKINFTDDKEINLQLTYNYNIEKHSSFNLGMVYRDYIKDEYLLLMKYNLYF